MYHTDPSGRPGGKPESLKTNSNTTGDCNPQLSCYCHTGPWGTCVTEGSEEVDSEENM